MKTGHELHQNRDDKNEREARNLVSLTIEALRFAQRSGNDLRITRRKILRLHRFALQDIYTCAGRLRDWPVLIKGAPHKPPEARYLKGHLAEMCERANHGTDWSPVKTAAYLIWRLNWIHPFGGGDGRVSRALGYYALCVRLGFARQVRSRSPIRSTGSEVAINRPCAMQTRPGIKTSSTSARWSP